MCVFQRAILFERWGNNVKRQDEPLPPMNNKLLLLKRTVVECECAHIHTQAVLTDGVILAAQLQRRPMA